MNDVYLIGEAASIVGVDPQVLRYWEQRGLLRPSVAAPPRRRWGKRGRPPGSVDRLYLRNDLLIGVLIRRFRAEGLSLQRVRKAVAALRKRFGDDPLSQALGGRFKLVIGQKTVAVVDDDAHAWDMVNAEQTVALYALSPEAKTVEKLIAAWRRTKVNEQRLAEAMELARLNRRQVRRPDLVEVTSEPARRGG
jgi:DNA-binding transcriptional MerR regulator